MKYQIKQKCWEVKYGKKSIFSYYNFNDFSITEWNSTLDRWNLR